MLQLQLAVEEFHVAHNQARLRIPSGTYYVPDVAVIPVGTMEPHWDETGVETYTESLPLVVEVWSPSTGEYDVETKLREYQLRCDLEIWRLDPRDCSLTAWVRRPDGSYEERRHGRTRVRLAALPAVVVDLDDLFRQARL